MKRIVSVSLGPASADYEFEAAFLGHEFHVQRFGTDGDVRAAAALLERCQGDADACGLGLVCDHALVGTRRVANRTTALLEQVVTRTPVTTGSRLRTFFDEFAIRHVQREEGEYFTNARVLFLSGALNHRVASTLLEYTRNVRFADPATLDGLPIVLRSLRALEAYTAASTRLFRQRRTAVATTSPPRVRWPRAAVCRAMKWAHFLVAPHEEAEQYTANELRRKVLITSSPIGSISEVCGVGVSALFSGNAASTLHQPAS